MEVLKFLASWLLLSDAVNTIITVAVLFAQTQLGASNLMLAALAALVPACAIAGAYGFLYIQRKFKITTKTMILIVVFLQIMIPFYGILGLFTPLGLKHQWELWPVACYHGLLLGAMQSFSRVLFAEMLPKSR
jgi:UMF1 family MFS transporter